MTANQPYYRKSLTLVIGINSYTDPRFVPLGEAENDARKVADLLKQPPYDFEVGMLLGEQATRQRILDAIYALRKAAADDRVLVYFAGHGYTETDNFGQETGYLAAVDTIHDRNSSALKLTDLTDLRRYSNAMHIGFIFDACFSGQALGITRSTAEVLDDRRRAFQVISAGAGDQTVSDYDSMTDAMVEALRGETPESDDMLTFNSLGLYLQQTISARSGRMQIPQFGSLTGHQGDDMVLYYDTAPRLPRELEQAVESSSANMRWGAVADLITLVEGDDPELAALADERLTQLLEDPDERVRNAAMRYVNPAITQQSVTLGQRPSPVTPEATGGSSAWLGLKPLWIAGGAGALLLTIGLIVVIASALGGGRGAELPPETESPEAATEVPTDEPTSINSPPSQAANPNSARPPELLTVPFVSQNDPDIASISVHDEGAACLAMLIAAKGAATISINDLYGLINLSSPDDLTPDELTEMAAAAGYGLETLTDLKPEDVEQLIDQQRPMIVPVDYQPFIVDTSPEGADDSHYVVVVGYDDDYIYVHDPLYADENVDGFETGKNREWQKELFRAVWQGTVYLLGDLTVAQVEFEEAVDAQITSTGFDAPVGTAEERQSDDIWPLSWSERSSYAEFYTAVGGAYHTGADLYFNGQSPDDEIVYAIGSGVVTFAGVASGSWGNIVVIRHDPLRDGTQVWSRYAHVDDLTVEQGDKVGRGQPIASIGNANGLLPYHLHFDIAQTNILELSPGHWPGANLELVFKHYIDPRSFLTEHRPSLAAQSGQCSDYAPLSSGPLSGIGLWMSGSYNDFVGMPPETVAAQLYNAGISYVLLTVADASSAWSPGYNQAMVEALHEVGIPVWGEHVFWGTSVHAETNTIIEQICTINLDGLLVNVPPPGLWEGSPDDMTGYLEQIDSTFPGIPIGMSTNILFSDTDFPTDQVLTRVDHVVPIYNNGITSNPADDIQSLLDKLEGRTRPTIVPFMFRGQAISSDVSARYLASLIESMQQLGLPAVVYSGEEGPLGDTFWDVLSEYAGSLD